MDFAKVVWKVEFYFARKYFALSQDSSASANAAELKCTLKLNFKG